MKKSLIVLAVLAVVLPAVAYAAYNVVLTLTMSKEVLQFNTLETEVPKANFYRYDTGIRFSVVDPNTNALAMRFRVSFEGVELSDNAYVKIEIDSVDKNGNLFYVTSAEGKKVGNEFIVDVHFSCEYDKDFAIVLTAYGLKNIKENAKIILTVEEMVASTKGFP